MLKAFQVIIPLTGYGSRFKAAGYERLKPFIEVQGKPMIEWVVKLFDKENDKISFLCRQEHLDELDYVRPELERIAPKAQIFAIDKWEKKGPAHDALRAAAIIDDNEPVILSYCDYYMHWDYLAFKRSALALNPDGAVPCYSGFHPHLLPQKNLYASCKVDPNEMLLEIREKFSFEKDKTLARHSPGVYYFKDGKTLKLAFEKSIEAQDHLGGEYYASLPYNQLVQLGKKIWCPINVSKFCQWGTPEDLEQYLFWTEKICKAHHPQHQGALL